MITLSFIELLIGLFVCLLKVIEDTDNNFVCSKLKEKTQEHIEPLIKQIMTEKQNGVSFELQLLKATKEGQYEIVKLLIEKGANLNPQLNK
jgi:ankyrin repeat protein